MKRVLALILALMMVLSLVACGGDKPSSTPTSSDKPATSTPATPDKPTEPSKPSEPEKPVEPKILKLVSAVAGSSAYSMVATTGMDQDFLQGLTQGRWFRTIPVGDKAVLSPVLAAEAPIDVNGDGITWNIKIRKDAKWANGDPINADTFMYTMKMGLDPKLVLPKCNSLAKNDVEILNAKAYCNQNTEGAPKVAWEDVGFKKIDDYTVQVTLATKATQTLVMRHFGLYAAAIHQPTFEKCLSADGTSTTYGTTADKTMAAGPFKIAKWEIGAVVEFVKNENYVFADQIKLDGVNIRIVEDANTHLQMFLNGEIDRVSLTPAARDQYAEDPRLVQVPSSYTGTIDICHTNTDEPILGNENFKKALFYATDRATICKLLGYDPALGYISKNTIADEATGVTFREMAAAKGYDQMENYGYDPVKAKQYFEKALQEVGVSSVEISFLCTSADSSPQHGVLSQYIQEDWQKIFGADKFKLVIDAQPSKNQLAQKKSSTTNPNAYELTISDWSWAPTGDPIKVMQFYTSQYANRNAPYGFKEVDDMWALADDPANRLDFDFRHQVAMRMEQHILEHAISIPVWYTNDFEMLSDRVELVFGDYDPVLGWGWAYCDIIQ